MNWNFVGVLKYLNYSSCSAVMITALAVTFHNNGGDYILQPGRYIEVLLAGLIMIIPTGDDYFVFPDATYLIFNVAFYAIIIYTLLLTFAYFRTATKQW